MCYNAFKVSDAPVVKSEPCVEENAKTLDDETLVTRAQRGERWAMEELIRRYEQTAYAIAYHTGVGDPEDAREVTQEAFLRTVRNLRRFKGTSSFSTWFYRIVVNTCLDRIRKRQRRNRLFALGSSQREEDESLPDYPDEAQDTNPLAVLTGKHLSQEIRRAVSALPERQRIAFQLKVLQGLSIKEIARIMNTAEGTVKSHIFRATQSLKEALSEWV